MRKHKIKLTEEYWLIKSDRSRVKRFSKNKQNKEKIYIYINSGRILGVLVKEIPPMTTKEEHKVDKARDEWKKLIAQGWRRTKPVWEDS